MTADPASAVWVAFFMPRLAVSFLHSGSCSSVPAPRVYASKLPSLELNILRPKTRRFKLFNQPPRRFTFPRSHPSIFFSYSPQSFLTAADKAKNEFLQKSASRCVVFLQITWCIVPKITPCDRRSAKAKSKIDSAT